MDLRKIFLASAMMLIFFQSSFADSVTAKKVLSPVAIDGLLEESFWDISNQISINLGGSNNTANFGVLWDNNYLYIGVSVVDECLCTNGRQGYYDDGVEICIDGNYSQGTTIDQYDRLFVKPVNSYWIQEKDVNNEGVIHQWIETNDGYSMEFAIPWDNFDVSPAAGMNIGFNVAVNDDDNCNYAYNLPLQLLWSGNSNYYKDPSCWGTINLSDQTVSYSGDYIALISPNGNDFCINNKTTDINWVSSGITNIDIDYSTDNGSSWNSIATNLSASSESYNWNISATPSGQCRIKISDADNPSINDISESQFTISEALTTVEPLIPNIWDVFQWPYNAYYPEDQDGINGHVGNSCGPSSLARILHYWEFPIVGNDELTYTDRGGNTWSANFGETTYNYDNMPNYLPENSTEEEYKDVATLFYHTATSMYDIYWTGTNLDNMSYAMSHYFNYKESAATLRKNHTKAEWIQIIINEIDNGRVLLIQGMTLSVRGNWHESNSTNGHWYNVDGYNEDGQLHVVRGYGDEDGYFDADSLLDFSFNLGILTGLEPNLNGKELTLLSPNGGELFSNIRETEITWNSSNISNLKIEYTIDNGKEWNQLIGSTTAGNYSYTWYLPGIVSDQCKIRLSDASDINIYDKSDGTFEIANDSLPLPSYFTDYDAFITKLTNLTSSSDSSAQLDKFWNELISTRNFPFAIDTEVTFLYRGSASTINWAGMFNNWDMNADAGNCLGVSDIWILEKEFPADTRSGYKIVRNGSEWLADPNNPHPLIGEYGNSELWMPEYVIPPETIPRLEIPKGTLTDNILKFSTNLNYTSQYRVYTPAGYSALSNLPTIYVTDGQNYLDDSMGKMVIVLDNLIADEIIKPVIAVFLDPRDPDNLSNDRRGSEYRNNINFANYVTLELIPDIDAAYKTNSSADARAIMGASWGGYNAEYFSVVVPDYFHKIGMNSPYLHPNGDYWVIDTLKTASLENMDLYLSSGIFDADAERYCNQLKDVYEQKGKEYRYTIIGDGHTWQNWSRVIGDALEYFFAELEAVSLSLTYPNGGEYFISGSIMNIKWNVNLVSDIEIEFSENNGSTWQEIIASTPASAQSFEWIVPDISSDQCLVKITDISDGTRYDESDNVFEIGAENIVGGPYAVDANTILLMHFENNLTNSSDLSDDGMAHGSGVSYSSSANSSLGQCIKLDNSNFSNKSYISISHNDNLNLSGSWTIEAWFYFNSMGADAAINPTIVSKASSFNNHNYFVWYHNSWGSVKGQFTNSNNVDIYVGIGNNTITTGNWYHIAYIRDDTQNVHRLLIRNENREIIAQNESQYDESQSTPILNVEDVLIGKILSPYSFYLDGYIDEVRISNVVRDFTVPPVVSDIPDQTIDEASSFATIQLDNFVSDPNNSDNEITWSYSGNSELIVNIDGSRVASITTPNEDWNGSETITFTATDPDGASNSDDATFTVTEVNDGPVVSDIPDQTIAEGNSFTRIQLDDFVTDVDNSDNEMNWSYSGNSELIVNIDGSRVASITTPNEDWNGSETITFTATDPEGDSGSDDATFTVTEVNDGPVVSDIPDQTINEGSSFATIKLDDFVTDPDNEASEISWSFSGNDELSVEIGGNRVATVSAPDENWFGSEIITFTATDPGNASSSNDVMFTVNSVNDPPVISGAPELVEFVSDTIVTIDIWSFVSDVETSIDLLLYDFNVDSDSILFSYDDGAGILTLSAELEFGGEGDLIWSVSDSIEIVEDTIHIVVEKAVITGIDEELIIPEEFALYQNYPNPFNPTTKLNYDLSKNGHVKITIFDVQGKMINTLVNGYRTAGSHSVNFNGTDLSSGIYFYTIEAGTFRKTKKMILIR